MTIEEKFQPLTGLLGKPDELLTSLLSIQIESKESEFQPTLVNFCSVNKVNLVRICLQSLKNGGDVFRLSYLLRGCFADLEEIVPIEVSDLLKIFSLKMNGDMFAGLFFADIRRFAAKKVVAAESVAKELLNNGNTESGGYLNTIYLGIADSDFERGYRYISGLITHTSETYRALGLRALGLLSKIPTELENEVIEILRSAANETNSTISSNAVFSICKLCARHPELQNDILDLSESPDPQIKFEVASLLQFRDGKLEAWESKCLRRLCSYDLKHKGITDCLDLILYHLTRAGETDEVLDVLKIWVVHRSAAEHRVHKINDLLDSTSFEMIQSSDLMRRLTFDWLNSDDYMLHHCLGEIINFMQLNGQKPPEFSDVQLAALSYDDSLYIVRKTLAYIFRFEFSAAILFSILRHPKPAASLEGMMTTVFVDHLGYNYPQKTLDFLKAASSSASCSPIEANVAKRAKQEIERRSAELRELEHINELLPNLDDQIQLDRQFQKNLAIQMKEARERSPLLSSVGTVAIKEGKGWFSYFGGKVSDVTEMTKFSQSLEFPRGDILDEVGACLERESFRRLRKEKM